MAVAASRPVAITQYVDREEKREAFRQAVKVLSLQPGMGRPVDGMDDEFRDWIRFSGR